MEINHGSESVLKVKLKFCRFSIAIYEKKKKMFLGNSLKITKNMLWKHGQVYNL